jgi:hypothetical protein
LNSFFIQYHSGNKVCHISMLILCFIKVKVFWAFWLPIIKLSVISRLFYL